MNEKHMISIIPPVIPIRFPLHPFNIEGFAGIPCLCLIDTRPVSSDPEYIQEIFNHEVEHARYIWCSFIIFTLCLYILPLPFTWWSVGFCWVTSALLQLADYFEQRALDAE